MAELSEDELRRRSETLSISERAVRDRESELASVQQIARIAGITVNLRNGFRHRPARRDGALPRVASGRDRHP